MYPEPIILPLTGGNWHLIYSVAFTVLFISILFIALQTPQGSRRWWALAGLAGVLIIAGQLFTDAWIHMIMFDSAALVTVGMVWDRKTAPAKNAARIYLVMLLAAVFLTAAGMFFAFGELLSALPLARITVALIVVGFGLKLALIPFFFWLPGVAEHASPLTTAVIVALVDISVFGELFHLITATPWVFTEYAAVWLAIALVSMFGGAVLALSQSDIKRMLAFSTIAGMGFLLIGVLTGSDIGIEGAFIGSLSHALSFTILFSAVGVVEARIGHSLTMKDRGVAANFPISGLAFLVGALNIIGIPPLLGFVGEWQLYLAGAEFGGAALVIAMAVVGAVTTLYYLRVVHHVWLGAPEREEFAKEPLLTKLILVTLVVFGIILGLFPGLISALIS